MQYYQEESPIRQAMMAASQQNMVVKAPVASVQKKASGYKPLAEGVAAMLSQQTNTGRRGAGTITFI